MRTKHLALALITCVLVAADAGAQQAVTAAEVDLVARSLAQRFDAPGMALAVVKDGQVVLTKGYGACTSGQRALVDEHTLFYTASVTKAFTVTALGILADEGKVRLDDPVVHYLPEFVLSDKARSDALTLRDLMSHRTGLPRADLLMVGGLSNQEILGRLKALAPQAPVRTRFSYQNQMYLVLGMLLEKMSGISWQQFVERRLLGPVGLHDGNAAGLGHWPRAATAATPHARTANGVAPVDLVPREPYGAGGLNASASDMAAWLKFQLGDGTANGARIVSRDVLAAQQSPNTLLAGNLSMPRAVVSSYGLGWFVHDYFGHKVVQHGGNGEGWTSLVLMVPDQHFGMAVMTNMHNSTLPYALAFTLVDRMLGREAHDWAADYLAAQRALGPPPLPALPPDAKAPGVLSIGNYENPLFGRATIEGDGNRILFDYGTLRGSIDGTTVTWLRTDMAAVLGPGRISMRDDTTLLLDVGGERFEFKRIR